MYYGFLVSQENNLDIRIIETASFIDFIYLSVLCGVILSCDSNDHNKNVNGLPLAII